MNLFKNTFDIISECANTECSKSEDVLYDTDDDIVDKVADAEAELTGEAEDDDEVEDSVEYSESAIPILATKTNYLIEFDMLAKYMETRDCSIRAAVENICEANCIEFGKTAILIESSDTYKQSIQEAKKSLKDATTKKDKLNIKKKLKNVGDTFKDLTKSGVKIVKKKSKKATK